MVSGSGGSGGVGMLAQSFPIFERMSQSGLSTQAADGMGGGRDPRLAMLDAAIQQAGIAGGGAVSAQWSLPGWVSDVVKTGKRVYDFGHGIGLFSEGPEQQVEMQFLENFLSSQVQDLIQKLYQYVNQYSQLVDCVPMVTKTVQQFGNKQYAAALSTGYQAYSCIRAKL